jgi:hypothetical protein
VRGDLGEMKIPWLIALMVLCCDPLAIALTGRGFGTAVIRAGILLCICGMPGVSKSERRARLS